MDLVLVDDKDSTVFREKEEPSRGDDNITDIIENCSVCRRFWLKNFSRGTKGIIIHSLMIVSRGYLSNQSHHNIPCVPNNYCTV
jgi:hypothetical protein